MQRNQLNDLFQSGLILGLLALFSVAIVSDLRQPAPQQDAAQQQLAQTAKAARHA